MFWNKQQSFLLEYSFKVLLFTLALALMVRLVFVSSFAIQTNSMSPTLKSGDFLLALKTFTPRRGDVVLLPCQDNELNTCVKRVVAIGGDRVEISKQRLSVNAIPAVYEKAEAGDGVLTEKWGDRSWSIEISSETPEEMAPAVVPPNQVFLLNDQRSDGSDSRQWGPIPLARLEARAWLIWLSIDWSKNSVNWYRMRPSID
jgi:signal peptidase I